MLIYVTLLYHVLLFCEVNRIKSQDQGGQQEQAGGEKS